METFKQNVYCRTITLYEITKMSVQTKNYLFPILKTACLCKKKSRGLENMYARNLLISKSNDT